MNPTKKKRLFIIDPSLKDFQGHHFTLTKYASLSAQLRDFSVTWICSTAFKVTPEMQVENIEIRPVLKVSMYDAYKKQKSNLSKSTEKPEALLAQAIIDALQEDNVTSDDRILFHTADGVTYLALSKIYSGLAPVRPTMHVCTPYDPVGVMPNREDAQAICDAIGALKKKGFIDKYVYLYGENELLAEHLAEIWKSNVRPLNLPANQHANRFSNTQLIQFRREFLNIKPNVFLCTYLGSARLEKGYHYLPYIVSRTYELMKEPKYSSLAAHEVKFAIQSSPQIIGYHQTIRNAIAKMKDASSPHISFVENVMSNNEYSKLLRCSDLILLPYEQQKYRVRGSGIASEAVESGKIIVGTSGSYPGYIGETYAGGSAEKPIDFARKILDIMLEKAAYKTAAESHALQFISKNDYRNYWKTCLEIETSC